MNEYYAAYGNVEITIILIFYTMHIPSCIKYTTIKYYYLNTNINPDWYR
jgi:hypothetical protein